MKTRTGNYPIGFRMRGWTNNVSFEEVLRWTKENGLGGVDIGSNADTVGQQVLDAGLWIGTADLRNARRLLSANAETRAAGLAENKAYIEACAKLGPMTYFGVMMPEDPSLPRAETFGYMVESWRELAKVMEANNARYVIEGWPGPGALCCTPETYRAFFEAVPSKAMGINFDPSHLLRMGINPIRFLKEFAGRVYHVHGKDTEILSDNVYEYGTEQPATFVKAKPFGGYAWRYTIPGHGLTPWCEVFSILQAHGYSGRVCIELEDMNFNDGGAEEQAGTLHAARYLTSA
ncbi:MAG: sugar phosphate isomerase/epimerase [Caldilineaceae bacterium]|nr:sugar phosphate isomerase/epimerase [Caldilineaceae bacterium]